MLHTANIIFIHLIDSMVIYINSYTVGILKKT